MTDAELIVASREDPLAFRQLYDRWADRLLAYFYQRVTTRPRSRAVWIAFGDGGGGSRAIVDLDATGRRVMVFAGPDRAARP